MEASIKVIGKYGLAGLIVYIGFEFWDKSIYISVPLIVIGVCLSIWIIGMDLYSQKVETEKY